MLKVGMFGGELKDGDFLVFSVVVWDLLLFSTGFVYVCVFGFYRVNCA